MISDNHYQNECKHFKGNFSLLRIHFKVRACENNFLIVQVLLVFSFLGASSADLSSYLLSFKYLLQLFASNLIVSSLKNLGNSSTMSIIAKLRCLTVEMMFY